MGAPKTDKKQEVKSEPKPNGRPSKYTPALADEICTLLAEGKSVRTVADIDGMPVASTIFKWLREIPEFSEQYDKAKEESADALVAEMLDIASEMPMIYEANADGQMVATKLDSAGVARNRLRVDTIKWYASKLKPKRFGDKTSVEHSGVVEVDHFNEALTSFMAIAEKKLA